MTPETEDLIKRLLCLEPQDRLGTKDVSEIKNHPFFNGIIWENLRKFPAPIIPHQHLKNPTNFEGRKKFEYFEQKEPFYQKNKPNNDLKSEEKLVYLWKFV